MVEIGASAERQAENQRDFGSNVTKPYIGPAIFTKPTIAEINDGDQLILPFVVGGSDEYQVAKGLQYPHIEWRPRFTINPTDEQAAQLNYQVDRIAYILGYFVKGGVATANTFVKGKGNDYQEYFDNLCENIIKGFEEHALENHSRKVVTIKLVGTTWMKNGAEDGRVGFPTYPPYISDPASGKPLSFSRTDLKNNRRYNAWVSGQTATATSTAEVASGEPDFNAF